MRSYWKRTTEKLCKMNRCECACSSTIRCMEACKRVLPRFLSVSVAHRCVCSQNKILFVCQRKFTWIHFFWAVSLHHCFFKLSFDHNLLDMYCFANGKQSACAVMACRRTSIRLSPGQAFVTGPSKMHSNQFESLWSPFVDRPVQALAAEAFKSAFQGVSMGPHCMATSAAA